MTETVVMTKFWTKNRVNIIVSAMIPLAFIPFMKSLADISGYCFLAWFLYMYLAAPILASYLGKDKIVKVRTKADVKSMNKPRGLYFRFGKKLYTRKELGQISSKCI